MDLGPIAGNFWSYVDVRDVANLVAAAVSADTGFDGHEAVLAAAPDNFLGVPTLDAIDAAFGGLPEETTIAGEESAFSTVKARQILGWEPAHTWREAADEEVADPELTVRS